MSEAAVTHDHETTIHIDRKPFKVVERALTGAQLRTLPTPPIGPDRDLFEVVPGPGEDILVGDDMSVELKEGMHFFSAPRTINPGGRATSS